MPKKDEASSLLQSGVGMLLWLKYGTLTHLALGWCITFSLVLYLAAHTCQAQYFCLFRSSSGLLWLISKAEEMELSV